MTRHRPETSPGPDSDLLAEASDRSQNLGRRAARGAAVTVTSNGIRFVIETARIIVLARLLNPADYGLVAMVTAVTGLMEMFKDLGLNMATVTRDRLSHAQISTVFWVNAAVGLTLSLLVAALAPLLAWFYGEPRLVWITVALAPTFLLAGLAVQQQALLRRQMKFGLLARARIIDVVSGVVVGIGVAWYGGAYWALVAMPVASAFASLTAVSIYSRWKPGRPVRGVGTRDMVRFGSQVMGTNLVTYLSRRLDQFLLGWWSGAVPLGLYTKSISLVEAPLSRALAPISTVVVPSLATLTTQPERYRQAYLRVLRMLCLISMPGAAVMIGCAPWLITLLLGAHWTDAAPIFSVLSVIGFVRPIEGSNWWLFTTQNRAAEGLRWSTIAAGISCVAVVVGLPWGALGVATAVAVASVCRLPLLVWYTTRTGPVRPSDVYKTLAVPAFASGAALAVLMALRPLAEAHRPIVVVAAGLVLAGVVFLAVFALIPEGRRTLQDAWSTALTLRRRRRG